MSLNEPIEARRSPLPPLTLAIRRPGHAAMRHLISQLDSRSLGDVVPPDLHSWHVGAIGEVLVGQELARLPAGWSVLHAVPAGPVADIDHLVIGPGGVFVINTKRHPNKRVGVGTHVVWINGVQDNSYITKLLSRTRKVRAILSAAVNSSAVQPLLVFVDVPRLTRSGEQAVAAVRADELVTYLLGRPTALEPGAVDAAVTLAARPATWSQRASVLQEPDPTARFLNLELMPAPAPAGVPLTESHVVGSRPRAAATTYGQRTPRRGPPMRTGGAGEFERTMKRALGALIVVVMAPFGVLAGLELFAALTRGLLGQ